MLKPSNLSKLPIAVLLLAFGISSIIYTPSNFFFDMRLRMLPGTPPYEFWANPPDNLIAKVYIFNITNPDQFLSGEDDDIHLQEIGPIIYREKFKHSNIVFNDNSTLTYTITRSLEYIPERNTIDLNATIIAPNLALLVMTSYFSDSSFFVKAPLKLLINRYKSQPFVNISIHAFLNNATDPLLQPARAIAPGMIPDTNVGVLNQMYLKNSYNITVLIGPKYGNSDYFTIERIDGVNSVPSFKRCRPKFDHTSETTLFPQFIGKTKINAWKAVLCKAAAGVYMNEINRYGMTVYRFDVVLDMFNRTKPDYEDCYRGSPVLPNGLADISTCYTNYPFAASFPHFMAADPIVSRRIKGLNPDYTKHGSFLLVEPISGIPVGGRAIFQINLIFRDMSGFGSKLNRFSNMYFPFAYVGYEIEGLPWYITGFMYLLTIIIPNIQLFLSVTSIISGLILLYYFSQIFRRSNRIKKIYKRNKEEETFLKL